VSLFSFLPRATVDMFCHRGSKKKKKAAPVEEGEEPETGERDIQ